MLAAQQNRETLQWRRSNPVGGLLSQRFVATIQLDGINPYVDVPHGVTQGLGARPPIPVLVLFLPDGSGGAEEPTPLSAPKDADQLRAIGRLSDDGWFRTTVLARRNAPARLYLDQWMRDVSGTVVGDTANVVLRVDTESRALELPMALRVALESDAPAKSAWESLTPSRQREILSHLNYLKTPAALERNVRKTLASLKSEESSG